MTLLDYANTREYPVIFWTSVGVPTGDQDPLGHPDLDFADRNGLLELTGTVNESSGEWSWDGEGHPTDDRWNSILSIVAWPNRERWEEIVAAYENGD